VKKVNKEQQQSRPPFLRVLAGSSLSFASMIPLLLGIIGLVGLFQVAVTPEMLGSLFGGNPLTDTFIGTLTGAVAAGNPMISYILGGELLDQGISLYAVTAFILAWVTLGLVQLPAEVEVFGGRFTLLRNLLAFVFTMLTAVLTTLTLQVLT
jgi:uncharacterized membrane protein YraQ (UPF0718 family)